MIDGLLMIERSTISTHWLPYFCVPTQWSTSALSASTTHHF